MVALLISFIANTTAVYAQAMPCAHSMNQAVSLQAASPVGEEMPCHDDVDQHDLNCSCACISAGSALYLSPDITFFHPVASQPLPILTAGSVLNRPFHLKRPPKI